MRHEGQHAKPASRMRGVFALALAFICAAIIMPAAWAEGGAEPEVSDVPAPVVAGGSPSSSGEVGTGEFPDAAVPADDQAGSPAAAAPDGSPDNAVAEGGDSFSAVSGEQGEPKDAPGSEDEPAPSDETADDPESTDPDRPYSLRLIVDLGGGQPREQDAVLGEHDGVWLLGFPDEESIAEAESHYSSTASWVQRDVAMGAAEGEAPADDPEPVAAGDDALTLLDEAPATGEAPAGKPLVALIDTGAPDDAAVIASASFAGGDDPADVNGHASAVLEAMKAEDPDVRVLALKALGDDGRGSASSVYAAVEYAVESGAKIINLSLAGYDNGGNAAIADAVSDALAAGCVVVAAAGNGGYDAGYITPANIPGVFTVGACDAEGNVLESSNRGSCVDGYVEADFTSYAAARVSGWLSKDGAADDWRSRIMDNGPAKQITPSSDESEESRPPDESGVTTAPYQYKIRTASVPTSGNKAYVKANGGNGSDIPGNAGYMNLNYRKGNSGAYTSGIWTSGGTQIKSLFAEMGTSRVKSNTVLRFRGICTTSTGEGGDWLATCPGTNYSGNSYSQIWADPNFINGSYFDAAGFDSSGYWNGTLYFIWAAFDVKITLSATGATNDSTRTKYIYEQYGTGLFTTDGCTSDSKVEAGGQITKPVRGSDIFTGYWESENGGTQYIDASGKLTSNLTSTTFGNSGNVTIYARWEPVYEIKLDNQGADAGSRGSSYVYERYGNGVYLSASDAAEGINSMSNSSNRINVPSKTGYTFDGYWTTANGVSGGVQLINANGSKTGSFGSKQFSQNTTIYAHWKEIPLYTITLHPNGGTAGTSAVYEYYGIDVYRNSGKTEAMRTNAYAITKPTRTHYTFAGFTRYQNSGTLLIDANGYRTNDFTADMFNQNTNIFARWNPNIYSVRLDNQGGGSTPAYVYEKYGDDIYTDSAATARVSSNNPVIASKSGMVFNGYYTATGGSGDRRIDKDGTVNGTWNTAYTDNSGVLYADWVGYKITLDDDGGKNDGTKAVYEHYNDGLYLDEHCSSVYKMSSSSNAVTPPTKDNYTFGGYYTGKRGEGSQVIDADGKVNATSLNLLYNTATWPQADKTVYAKWIPAIYKIDLDANNPDSVTTNLAQNSEAVYERYGESVHLTLNDANTSANGMTTSANPITPPEKTGYTFRGYFTVSGAKYIDENGKRTASFTDTSFNAISDPYKLYAHWDRIPPWKISLDDNGGQDGADAVWEWRGNDVYLNEAMTYAMSDSANPVIPLPTREHYTFRGYFRNKTASSPGKQYIDANGYRIVANFPSTEFSTAATIYAQWDPDVYRVALDNQGADVAAGSSYVYERYGDDIYLDNPPATKVSASNPITRPQKSGLVFAGYYTGTGGQGSLYINNSGVTTGSFSNTAFGDNTGVLYADWLGYRITLDDAGGRDGSGTVWERYNVGLYLDNHCTDANAMALEGNTVAVPTKANYTFGGYYTGTNGGGYQVIDADGAVNSASLVTLYSTASGSWPMQDKTIHALWIPNIYPVELDANNPDDVTSNLTQNSEAVYERYGESVHLSEEEAAVPENAMTGTERPITPHAKVGWTFLGYFTGVTGGNMYIDANGYIASFNTTHFSSTTAPNKLYAHWEKDPAYEITLDDNGGEEGSGSVWEVYGTDVFLDQALTQPMSDSENGVDIPTRDHYTFLGYFKNQSASSPGTQYIGADGYRIVANFPNTEFRAAATIYAQWDPDIYQVKLDNQGADAGREGSELLYERYGESVHLSQDDAEAPVRAMSASANPIVLPEKDGKEFAGYFTEPDGQGDCYIDARGRKTTAFTPSTFERDYEIGEVSYGVLYAYWKTPPVAILPITGGIGENLLLLWGAAAAVVAAAGVLMFRSLRRRPTHVPARGISGGVTRRVNVAGKAAAAKKAGVSASRSHEPARTTRHAPTAPSTGKVWLPSTISRR